MQRQEKRNASGKSSSGKSWIIRRVIGGGASQRDKSIRVSKQAHPPLFSLLYHLQDPLNLRLSTYPCPLSSLAPGAADTGSQLNPWWQLRRLLLTSTGQRFGLAGTRQLHTCSPVTPTTKLRTQIIQIPKHKLTNRQTPTQN